MPASLKRKNTSEDPQQVKRLRVDSGESRGGIRNGPATLPSATPRQERCPSNARPRRKGKGKQTTTAESSTTQLKRVTAKPTRVSSNGKETIHKLAPPRPFPTVPTSVSATGPRSAHKEGQNLICITRHTPLAAYLSRCKKLLVEDGYQTLHLHAMGAAIPHLLTLTVSLPPILPFPRDEVKVEVRTGTIEVTDEIIPENEDEDMSLRVRNKGGVSIMIQIRGGKECVSAAAQNPQPANSAGDKGKKPTVLVVQEQEQDDNEMDEDEDEEELEAGD